MLRPQGNRINWDNGAGAQSSKQEEQKSCRSQVDQVTWVSSVPAVPEESRGALLLTWQVLPKVLNPHFEPRDHLYSKGTAAHSEAEVQLFTPSHYKTHFL